MRIKTLLFILLLFCNAAISAADSDNFFIRVSVAVDGQPGSSRGSGGFSVTEGKYGRIGIIFGSDPADFVIRSAGNVQLPISHSLGSEATPGIPDKTQMVLDIYLKAQVNKDSKIRISGIIVKSGRVHNLNPPAFTYSEEKVEYILESGHEQELAIDSGVSGHAVQLAISVEKLGSLSHEPRTNRYVTFESVYSLFNNDTKEYDTKDCHCTLGMGNAGDESKGECHYRMVYNLTDGNVLLYLSSFSIDQVTWNDNNTITFNFVANHIYAVNPADTLAAAVDLESEKTTVTVLSKAITIRPGKTLEIEIPAESDSPLPFNATETVILYNSVIADSN